jgi:hypothetical protein
MKNLCRAELDAKILMDFKLVVVLKELVVIYFKAHLLPSSGETD